MFARPARRRGFCFVVGEPFPFADDELERWRTGTGLMSTGATEPSRWYLVQLGVTGFSNKHSRSAKQVAFAMRFSREGMVPGFKPRACSIIADAKGSCSSSKGGQLDPCPSTQDLFGSGTLNVVLNSATTRAAYGPRRGVMRSFRTNASHLDFRMPSLCLASLLEVKCILGQTRAGSCSGGR